ncbi:hypothetical protein [Lyngbya confervoides]|uniref:Histidine kinase n=1 Tax=Lyngbya confervoides BDU141951 TaxID=1574623 RepID=A0ABD4T6U1_9CYAN|nr:hypothetical protein [Lyngbya confervoides]MCM1984438.1 hypothetical protein [Lyngbya confervoides BDU141951]
MVYSCAEMQKIILQQRLKAMGLNKFQLAKLIAGIRERKDGKEYDPRSLSSAIRQALEQPGRSRLETIEEIVEALDGELVIRWKKYERVVKGYQEISLDSSAEEIAEQLLEEE